MQSTLPNEIRRWNLGVAIAFIMCLPIPAAVVVAASVIESIAVLRYGLAATMLLAASTGAALGFWRRRIERQTGYRFRLPFSWKKRV
jgi:hypothetical protein